MIFNSSLISRYLVDVEVVVLVRISETCGWLAFRGLIVRWCRLRECLQGFFCGGVLSIYEHVIGNVGDSEILGSFGVSDCDGEFCRKLGAYGRDVYADVLGISDAKYS